MGKDWNSRDSYYLCQRDSLPLTSADSADKLIAKQCVSSCLETKNLDQSLSHNSDLLCSHLALDFRRRRLRVDGEAKCVEDVEVGEVNIRYSGKLTSSLKKREVPSALYTTSPRKCFLISSRDVPK